MTVTPKTLVAVIIINYDGLDDTLECLASLRESDFKDFITIVVDNASRHDPTAAIAAVYPEVLTIKSRINLGFTGGNNLGLTKAYEFDPRYIFFLNNDTVVTPDLLSTLVGFMEGNPDVGLAGPLTYYFDEPELVCFSGGHLDRNTGRIAFIGKGARLTDTSQESIYCSFVEGAAIFIRTELVRKIGGFNDQYFLTSEESELCVKVADMGYKLAVLTTCSLFHKVSRSMGAGSELINYFVYRNRLHFIRNNARKFRLREAVGITYNYLASFISLTVKLRNWGAARGLALGVCDFLCGVKGAGRYSRQLQGCPPGFGEGL